MDRIPITPEGCKKLQEELEHIVKVLLPQNITDIETARSHGDLTENAEYHAAKDTNGMLRMRVNELQDRLARCEVVDPASTPKDRVVFGAHVTLENLDSGEQKRYQVLGPFDSNPNEGTISFASPLGRAMLGKEEGDVVEFHAPGGSQKMEIVEIT